LQDEWKLLPQVTVNFGARFDGIDSFVDENQASPRVNAIYKPTDSTALHAGYARYFTPPALETINSTTTSKFEGTSNASDVGQGAKPRSERSDYFDAGLTQKIIPGLELGVDGYYKKAKNQLDDGFFSASYIPSQFNYREGRVYGVEFTANYVHEGFSAFANVAYSVAQGKDVVSGQFLFDAEDLAYIHNHWVYLDHDQRVTGSFGAAYLWKRSDGSTRLHVDALYGSGLRTDATEGDITIPNGGSVPAYYSVSVGIEEGINFHGKERLKARFDIVNVTDNSYELRDGSGIGVNASQYGMRLGFFGGLSMAF
jgi:outer membrane receptor protein involved in Fe transport